MLGSIVTAIVTALTQLLPLVTTSGHVATFINMLIEILPTVGQLAEDLYQPIKNIIEALKQNAATTLDQINQLADLDAKYDQAFEAAATAAEAEDAAADAAANPPSTEPPPAPPSTGP